MKLIKRDNYLNKLIAHKNNERIKIITGIRRCGKSYLLSKMFKKHLIQEGIKKDHIIEIAFDDWKNRQLRKGDDCYKFITSKIKDSNTHYILLDEVQMLEHFTDVLNGFLHIKNIDVYVTGSNSKFLSTDVATEFRGRGDEIRMFPLSFAEFNSVIQLDWNTAWKQYYTFGGLPYLTTLENDEEKMNYLKNLLQETYLRDIIEHNNIRNDVELNILIDIIASDVGSLTNPEKLANTFKSVSKSDISAVTIRKYLQYLTNSFLISPANRYDIKGKKYINTPLKYYFEDVGLRNMRLKFRQQEENHIMENIIYNELRQRGFAVDVGMLLIRPREKDSLTYKQLEIDFIANKGSNRYYIQSAFNIPTEQKRQQEERPLLQINDSFKKIIIVKDDIMPKRDDKAVLTIGLKDFLLKPEIIDF